MTSVEALACCVYRIICLKTGKSYVGQTNSFARRIQRHWRELRKGNHHSAKLQRAYNRYGKSAFKVEVLEEGLTAEKADTREKHWVCELDSLRHGYNMTAGGNSGGGTPPTTPCMWNGKAYPSIAEAARDLQILPSTLRWRLSHGYSVDADLGEVHVACEWNGVQYPSIKEAAKTIGISAAAMQFRKSRGYSCDGDLTDQSKECEWNGIRYPSINAAALATGINEFTLRKRVRRGYTSDADLKARVR